MTDYSNVYITGAGPQCFWALGFRAFRVWGFMLSGLGLQVLVFGALGLRGYF